MILAQDRRSNMCVAQSVYFVDKGILTKDNNCLDDDNSGASAFSAALLQVAKNVKQYLHAKSQTR